LVPAAVPPLQPVAPADTTFYGEAVRDLYEKRVEVAVEKQRNRAKPVMELVRRAGLNEEAEIIERLIAKGQMPADRLEKIEKAFAEGARQLGAPTVHPIVQGVYYIGEWELGNWLRSGVMTSQLERIETLLQQRNERKEAA
jgi:hypothetical protein